MPSAKARVPQLYGSSLRTLARFLAERGLSDAEIERGLDYVEAVGARTIRQGFVLAMSRVWYSDEQRAAGARFTFD